MNTAQERFFRNREERDRARFAAKDKGTSSQILAEQRDAVLRELEQYEKQVATALNGKDYQSADEALRALRQLVQDAAATETLTAYEMAKANQMVSTFHEERLKAKNNQRNDVVDDACSTIKNNYTVEHPPIDRQCDVHQGVCPSLVSTSQGVLSSSSSGVESDCQASSSGKRRFRFSAFASTSKNGGGNVAMTESKQMAEAEKEKAKGLPLQSPCGEKLDNGVEKNPYSTAESRIDVDASVSYGHMRDTTILIPSGSALFLRECVGCQIFVLPIHGSAFVTGLKSCRLFIASSQLRLKDCDDVEVYAWVSSTPIIENCSSIRVGPYSCWRGLTLGPVPLPATLSVKRGYPTQKQYNSHADCVREFFDRNEVTGETNWQHVEDFQWLKKAASPHWRRLEPSEFHYADILFQKATSSSC